MATALILVVALVTVANGDITGTVPSNGACLCFNGDSVNARSSACGQRIIGSANSGQCFTYAGSNTRCTLNSRSYQFFKINYNRNRQGWSAGLYLNLESDSRCVSSGGRRALSLTELYNSRVVSAQRYERPLDFNAPQWVKNLLPNHCGVVVTLANGQRWLVHKGNEFGQASQTVVVEARHMSSNWNLKETKSVSNSRVTDYVSAGGQLYNTLLDNCLHACSRMMNLS